VTLPVFRRSGFFFGIDREKIEEGLTRLKAYLER